MSNKVTKMDNFVTPFGPRYHLIDRLPDRGEGHLAAGVNRLEEHRQRRCARRSVTRREEGAGQEGGRGLREGRGLSVKLTDPSRAATAEAAVTSEDPRRGASPRRPRPIR